MARAAADKDGLAGFQPCNKMGGGGPHNRRFVRDRERHCRIAAAFVRMTMIRIMLGRIAATPSP